MTRKIGVSITICLMTLPVFLGVSSSHAQGKGGEKKFGVEEASITDIQSAIRSGQTSCKQVVQAYIARAKAYNGVCTALLTKDGAPIPPAIGMVRVGSPIAYPTNTVAASTVFPGLDQYAGTPLELGRMIQSVSDPSVQLQYGWRVGIPDAGQLNALETLNIRGERSTTCKGDFDRAPADGPLPAGAPTVCEEFRKMPDAVERAAELDKQYGRNPDLKKLPLYCSVMSLKDWYDAKDMRATGGNDVNFAMDVPKVDSPDIAALRSKGAIIYAVSTASNVPGASSAVGSNKPNEVIPETNLQYAPWGGQACNPYDTARVPRGTSNGSGVSVSANLATCGICEQTSASCKGPASRNDIALILPTKGIMQDGGAMYHGPGDRAGIHCKTIKDAALVLDSIKGFKLEDNFSAIPKGTIPDKPYSGVLVPDSAVKDKPLKGIRIAIVREFMVKHTKNDVAISDQMDKEIKEVLRDKLGAELVETLDPMYSDDPTIPNVTYSFRDAMAEILPTVVPEYFFRTKGSAKSFGEGAKSSATVPKSQLEFDVPGWDVRSADYDVALSLHKAPLSDKINIRSIAKGYTNPSSIIPVNQYLAARGDTRVKDWKSWVDNATFKTDAERARALNAVGLNDPRPAPGSISYLEMQAVTRMIVLKVMQVNHIDAFVNPEQTTTPYLLGGALEPEVNDRGSQSCCQGFTAILGSPEADVPAGFVTTTVDPKYVLNADKTEYIPTTGDVQTKLPHPLPISLMVWAGPGYDSEVIKVASAFESATHHRVPPPAFGPVAIPAGVPAKISSVKTNNKTGAAQ
ncbi:MAG: amidase, Asp-tRNAAsn/Glu-tRNAGln amidotransferase subunit [Edaphobacter sp.]|nr:amidase, Asp-tRNAAsn/Glu-tRNAGln amidotransferase subunit [Edaphobacter sp.]